MNNVHFVVRPLNEQELPEGLSDKVLAKTYLELAYSLDSEVAAAGWDQPPQLLILRVRGRTSQPGVSALAVEGTVLPQFDRLVHRYTSQGGRMHHALLHAADAWRTLIELPAFRSLDMDDVQGIALVHEGWALFRPSDEAAQQEHLQAMRTRKVEQHPDRVEVRMIHIAGPNGLRVSLNLPRDGVPVHMIGEAVPGAHVSTYQVGGEVPNALHYFLEVARGQEPGEWEAWSEQYDYDSALPS